MTTQKELDLIDNFLKRGRKLERDIRDITAGLEQMTKENTVKLILHWVDNENTPGITFNVDFQGYEDDRPTSVCWANDLLAHRAEDIHQAIRGIVVEEAQRLRADLRSMDIRLCQERTPEAGRLMTPKQAAELEASK